MEPPVGRSQAVRELRLRMDRKRSRLLPHDSFCIHACAGTPPAMWEPVRISALRSLSYLKCGGFQLWCGWACCGDGAAARLDMAARLTRCDKASFALLGHPAAATSACICATLAYFAVHNVGEAHSRT